MTDVRHRPWRRVVWTVAAVLIVGNLAIALWLWNASARWARLSALIPKGKIFDAETQQELKRLSAQVAERYNAEVRDYRMLGRIVHYARDREEFLVTSGDDIVASVVCSGQEELGKRNPLVMRYPEYDEDELNRVRVLVYIPPGDHRLKYSFKEVWGEGYSGHFEMRAYEASDQEAGGRTKSRSSCRRAGFMRSSLPSSKTARQPTCVFP